MGRPLTPPRVLLDPGVLVAAVLSAKGAPAELLRRWAKGDFTLVLSPHLLGKLEGVLARPKFRPYLTQEEARAYVGLLKR